MQYQSFNLGYLMPFEHYLLIKTGCIDKLAIKSSLEVLKFQEDIYIK